MRQSASRVDGPAPDELSWAWVQTEMLRLHVRRRLSAQLDGIKHGPDGSLDQLLMTWVEQSVGHAALATVGTGDEDLFGAYVQPRADRHGRHVTDPEETSSRNASWDCEREELTCTTCPTPDELNAVKDPLHVGLVRIWEALNWDADARAAVITGADGRSRRAATSTTS